MKIEKTTDSGVIAVFVEGLETTPGWVALSRKKQDALLEHTSNIQQNRQLKMLGEFGELMELHHVQELLEGEEMGMADYMAKLYTDKHDRTVRRKLDVFNQIVANMPHSELERLRSLGRDVMGRFERIARAALGDIRNAVRELASLPAAKPGKYLEALDSKLLEQRQARRKGITLHRDAEDASKMAANALINYGSGCGLKTSAEWRHFLVRVCGWTMEARAVTGTVKTTRVPIPDGVVVRRGRPRMSAEEKLKAKEAREARKEAA